MKKILFMCGLLLLSACASHSEQYSETLEEWVGRPEFVLQETWGMPDNEFYVTPEEKIVTYVNYSNQPVGGNTEPYAGYEVYYPAITSPDYGFPDNSSSNDFYYCKTSFTIQNGTVINYSFNGDDCVSGS